MLSECSFPWVAGRWFHRLEPMEPSSWHHQGGRNHRDVWVETKTSTWTMLPHINPISTLFVMCHWLWLLPCVQQWWSSGYLIIILIIRLKTVSDLPLWTCICVQKNGVSRSCWYSRFISLWKWIYTPYHVPRIPHQRLLIYKVLHELAPAYITNNCAMTLSSQRLLSSSYQLLFSPPLKKTMMLSECSFAMGGRKMVP